MDITAADVEAAYPLWKTWTGADQLCHARRMEGAAGIETGEDWQDLMDQVRCAEAMLKATRF